MAAEEGSERFEGDKGMQQQKEPSNERDSLSQRSIRTKGQVPPRPNAVTPDAEPAKAPAPEEPPHPGHHKRWKVAEWLSVGARELPELLRDLEVVLVHTLLFLIFVYGLWNILVVLFHAHPPIAGAMEGQLGASRAGPEGKL